MSPTPTGPWLAAAPDPVAALPSHLLQPQLAQAAGLASFSSISPEINSEVQAVRFPSRGWRVQPASFVVRGH